MPHRVFINHSISDQQAAQTVCRFLEQNGIPCWISPGNIAPGQNFDTAITEAVDHSELLLVLLSSSFEESQQAIYIVQHAISKDLTILPVLIDEGSPSGFYRNLLGNLHWLNASPPPFESHLDSILEQVQLFLARKPGGPVPIPLKNNGDQETPQAEFELEIVLDESRIRKSLPIGRAVSIGRTEGDVLIPDPSLSDPHCRLYPAITALKVEDLGSRSGVFIRVDEEVELHDRDQISIGTLLFRIEVINQ